MAATTIRSKRRRVVPDVSRGDTLEQALRKAAITRWNGRRSAPVLISCAESLLLAVAKAEGSSIDQMLVREVTPAKVASAVTEWTRAGLAPSTINKRLTCAGVCGLPVAGLFVYDPPKPKWWLTPQLAVRVYNYCSSSQAPSDKLLRDYIHWAQATGLRIEESLRLKVGHISGWDTGRLSVTVPGTKTALSEATLPLSPEAAEFITSRFSATTDPAVVIFPVSYGALKKAWSRARVAAGIPATSMTTLKAIRRVAARNLHVGKGMPLDLVRQYLRHGDIKTTMGYLRLTGGYSEGEMRKYLDGEGS